VSIASSQNQGGTVRLYLKRSEGEVTIVSEPIVKRLGNDGSFYANLGFAVSTDSSGIQTILNACDSDHVAVEITMDNGNRKLFEDISLTGLYSASSAAFALELPSIWNNGLGVEVDSDIIETSVCLKRGYNMVALLVEPETSITSKGLLEILGPNAIVVAHFSANSGRYLQSIRTSMGILGDDFKIEPTDGVFVKVLSDVLRSPEDSGFQGTLWSDNSHRHRKWSLLRSNCESDRVHLRLRADRSPPELPWPHPESKFRRKGLNRRCIPRDGHRACRDA